MDNVNDIMHVYFIEDDDRISKCLRRGQVTVARLAMMFKVFRFEKENTCFVFCFFNFVVYLKHFISICKKYNPRINYLT